MVALAAAIAVIMALPGFVTVPPIDRDEARFAQATKQMMETGDYIDIRLQEEARHKKPVGIYWLQVAAAKLTGQGADAAISIYRLPSLMGFVAAVAATVWLGTLLTPGATPLLAGLFVASAILPGVEARLAKTDAVLLATIVVFHALIARAWFADTPGWRARWSLWAVGWAAMGVGILVKGPIAPMVAGATVLSLCVVSKRYRWLAGMRPLLGLGLALFIAAPWYVAIMIQTDGAFLAASAGEDLLGKAVSGQESHGAPPGVHVLASIGTFWPLSAFVILLAAGIYAKRATPVAVFCLCWAIPTWIIFELVPTKLPHYVLPALPPIAILVAFALSEGWATRRLWTMRVARALILVVPIVFSLVSIAAAIYLSSPRIAIGALLLMTASVWAWRVTRDRDVSHWAWHAPSVAFLVYLGTYPFVFAGLSPLWVSPALARVKADVQRCESPDVIVSGFREPSGVFLLGTGTRLLRDEAASNAFARADCAVAFVEHRRLDGFRTDSEPLPVIVEGYNLNGGDALKFSVYAKP